MQVQSLLRTTGVAIRLLRAFESTMKEVDAKESKLTITKLPDEQRTGDATT